MALPEDDEIANGAVDFLAKRGGRGTSGEVAEALAKRFRLTEADLARRIEHSKRSGGESAWKQRLRRVKFTLVSEGKLTRSKERGIWQLARS